MTPRIFWVFFNDVTSIQLGDEVSVQGVKTGKVKSISLTKSLSLVKIDFPVFVKISKGSDVHLNNAGLFVKKPFYIMQSYSNDFYNNSKSLSVREMVSGLTNQFD